MASVSHRVHRLTVEEYLRAAEGDPAWDGTELVEGVVYDVTPGSALHVDAVDAVYLALRAALPGHRVRQAGSVRLADDSMWEPDVYVGPVLDPPARYPSSSDLLLVVEVSVSTLRHDLGPKSRGYAANGVPEYWALVPDPGGYLLVHTDPAGDVYRSVDRLDLPGGFEDLDVAAVVVRSGRGRDHLG